MFSALPPGTAPYLNQSIFTLLIFLHKKTFSTFSPSVAIFEPTLLLKKERFENFDKNTNCIFDRELYVSGQVRNVNRIA